MPDGPFSNPIHGPRIVCVTGNVASGKSTLTALLARAFPGATSAPEPHTENPFLTLYLQDRARWGFTAQLHYFYGYLKAYREALGRGEPSWVFVDAGIWTNQYIYGRYLHDHNLMTTDEYSFFETLCQELRQTTIAPEPHAYIFLHLSPEKCFERMTRRAWAYQTNAIELAYLQGLGEYFAQMQAEVNRETPTLTLDSAAINITLPEGRATALSVVEGFFRRHQLLDS